MKVNTDPKKIDEFLDRGPVEIITREELKKKMLSGKQLRAYIGYDVTGPDLHLGNASTMMKLRDWQELGHQVVLVIGDYTSRVGDHSDKLEKRKRLTVEEIDENKKKFEKQFGKVVDLAKAEVRYNSEWLSKLSFSDVVDLASLFSVQQMIERENFALRLKDNKSIGLEELLYPLMQGYDSVALKIDLEMGGTDQTFNILAGRKIQEAFKMTPQSVITMPLIAGTDGRKMSKSWGNYVAILAEPSEMFGGIMSCVDDVIVQYFTLLTRVPMAEVKEIEKQLEGGKVNPIELKKKLAFEITKLFSNETEAKKAQEHFENTVQKGQTPDEIKTYEVSKLLAKEINIVDLLDQIGITPSRGEAKRLVKQGGVEVDEKKITDIDVKITVKSGVIVKAGKRNWIKLV